MSQLDFIQAGHELFRRHPQRLRHSRLLLGLYIGMCETELREFMHAGGEEAFVEVIEEAQHHGGAWVCDGVPIPSERPECGHMSTYHLSLWWLIDRNDLTMDDLADVNPLGKHLSWGPDPDSEAA